MDPPDSKSLNIYQFEWKNEEDAKIAEVRRENLCFYLETIKELKEKNQSCPLYLFIGEAPGRWGCFQTGVPFTDINTLVENVFFEGRRKELENGKKLEKEKLIRLHIASSKEKILEKEISENSSTVVWECLNELPRSKDGKLPLFWNIYPFHPSDVIDKYVLPEERPNRTPEAVEKLKVVEILLNFLKIFPNINKIYAVGHEAERTLKNEKILEDAQTEKKLEEMLKKATYVHHPAYGKGKKFKDEFKAIMGSILYVESKQKNKN